MKLGQPLLDLFYPIGTYYSTSDTTFNPNSSWGGTWVLDTDGTVLVSKSSTTGSKFNVNVGTVVGEEKHTQTLDELCPHDHTYVVVSGGGNLGAAGVEPTAAEGKTYATGGGQPFNIVQPSKVINRWHRTA
jgi:hypothetical protein